MIENDVVVTTKYGEMPSFMVRPSTPGPCPAVIFYMDAPGIREELRNMARRIARQGYVCLLPDLYYRLGTVRFDTARRDEGMTPVIRAAMNHLTIERVMDDTAGMLAFLDAQETVMPGPAGCVGYCMSGQYVTTAMARFPHKIASGVSLYGIAMVTDREDSPHLVVDRIKGEIYYGFGELDQAAPAEMRATLQAALDKAGTHYEMKVFDGVHHGFAFPERNVYDTFAAEESWEKMFALWERTLK